MDLRMLRTDLMSSMRSKKPSLFETRLSYAFCDYLEKQGKPFVDFRAVLPLCLRHTRRSRRSGSFHPSCCGSLLMQRHRGTHVTEEGNHTNLDGSASDCVSDDSIILISLILLNGLQGLEDIYEIVSEYKQQLCKITSIWDFGRFMLHASLQIEAWILIYESGDQRRRREVQVHFQSKNM